MTCLYRLPSQNQEQFGTVCENLINVLSGINKQQPEGSIPVVDFNAKLSKWCLSDKYNKTGQEVDAFTTMLGYIDMTGQPMRITNNKSSRIDFFFTTNSKWLSEIGVEQPIYDKSHHNTILRSLNLNIRLPPPS